MILLIIYDSTWKNFLVYDVSIDTWYCPTSPIKQKYFYLVEFFKGKSFIHCNSIHCIRTMKQNDILNSIFKLGQIWRKFTLHLLHSILSPTIIFHYISSIAPVIKEKCHRIAMCLFEFPSLSLLLNLVKSTATVH